MMGGSADQKTLKAAVADRVKGMTGMRDFS